MQLSEICGLEQHVDFLRYSIILFGGIGWGGVGLGWSGLGGGTPQVYTNPRYHFPARIKKLMSLLYIHIDQVISAGYAAFWIPFRIAAVSASRTAPLSGTPGVSGLFPTSV